MNTEQVRVYEHMNVANFFFITMLHCLDIRQMEHVPGRSINLAMSIRGLSALNSIGLGNHIAEEYGIPMRARMIHRLDGSTYPVPYGKKDQAIFSVGRRYINEILLTGKYNHKKYLI